MLRSDNCVESAPSSCVLPHSIMKREGKKIWQFISDTKFITDPLLRCTSLQEARGHLRIGTRSVFSRGSLHTKSIKKVNVLSRVRPK